MDDRRLTVTGHLEELRKRLLISLGALILGALISAPLVPQILEFLRWPAKGALGPLVYFSPEEPFTIYMRIAFLAGLLLALPVISYQAWAFVVPALEKEFRRGAAVFVTVSTLVFAAGCTFAYAVLLPAALQFLLSMGRGQLEPVISAGRYISFVTAFMFACGTVFELPVASFFLARTGIISAGLMRRKFKYAALAICVAAAVITPTGDVFNMMMLAIPMLALYEISIWVAFFARRRKISYDTEIVR